LKPSSWKLGGRQLAGALPDDGRLDVVCVQRVGVRDEVVTVGDRRAALTRGDAFAPVERVGQVSELPAGRV
jgi:hypothetical protein